VLYPLAHAAQVDKTLLSAAATPVVVAVAWRVVRSIRKPH
jgi:uncharacterized membrane-anchored protein